MPVDDSDSSFGARLRWAREQRGLSGRELARLIDRADRSIYRYEGQQKLMPSRSNLNKLARALGVSAAWLEYGRGHPYGMQAVEQYLQGDKGKDTPSDVADALHEIPWDTMGMSDPRPEQVHRVRMMLELVMYSGP